MEEQESDKARKRRRCCTGHCWLCFLMVLVALAITCFIVYVHNPYGVVGFVTDYSVWLYNVVIAFLFPDSEEAVEVMPETPIS